LERSKPRKRGSWNRKKKMDFETEEIYEV